MSKPLLSAEQLDVRIEEKLLVSGLDLNVYAQDCVCVLGLNGSGKTSTLETLAGVRPVTTGTIKVDENDITALKRRDLAQTMALLTQTHEDAFPTTVLETCLVGRHPHIDFWSWESTEDLKIARAALEQMHLAEFENRLAETLSGGERQRLAIAAILTQSPRVLLLDEPLNHLDPPHQVQVLEIMRRLRQEGCGIVASFHDINLAMRLCNKALLLFEDGSWRSGPVDDIINQENLEKLYKTNFHAIGHDAKNYFLPA